MTKHNDLEEPEKYYQIKFVEFLDFLGRLALDYFEELGHGPTDLEDKAHEILKLIWPAKAGTGGKEEAKRKDRRNRGQKT